MSGDIRNGILQAPALSLRDWLAGLAMQTCLLSALGAEDDETSLPMVPKAAYAVADMMLVARVNAAAEAERQKRLAELGQGCVDWAIDTDGCHMCERNDDGTHDDDCPVGEFIREVKAAETIPAPAPHDGQLGPNDVHEDVGLAVAVPEEAVRLVGASRNGDGNG